MPSPSPIPTPEPHLSVHLSQNYGEPLQCDVKIDGRKVFSGVTWEALTPAVKVPRVSSDRAGDIMREFFSTHPSVTNRGSTPADDLPGDRRVNVTITDVYAVPDEHGFLRINVGPEGATVDPDARNVTVTDVSDAPADDLPGEPVDHCPHSTYDRGDGTTSECSLSSGHAPTAHDSGDGVMWTDGEHWKDEESNLNDLPGEPVEPGDLRAGDRVTFTYRGERITCNLVSVPDALRSDAPVAGGFAPNVVWRDRWDGGVSDVRLIGRAPRENDQCEVDGSLAEALRKAYSTGDWLDVARTARKHIEAEQESRERTVVDEWGDMLARAENAEKALGNATVRVLALTAERDALRERLDAFREDVEEILHEHRASDGGSRRLADALARDGERAAKGEQR